MNVSDERLWDIHCGRDLPDTTEALSLLRQLASELLTRRHACGWMTAELNRLQVEGVKPSHVVEVPE